MMKKILLLMAAWTTIFTSCSAENDNTDMHNTETYKVTTSDLWTSRGSLRIYGKLYTSQGISGKLPVVILSHGFGGNYANGADYAERLAKMGYMAYAFDFCGGSTGSRSDGATTDMSILTEKADLNSIIDCFRTRSDVDASRISLAGASQGGMVSALTAAERPDDIASLMLFYSALSIVDDAHRRWASYESITSSNLCGTPLGAVYYQDAWNVDVYEELVKYHGPVLLLHGTSDNIVNISYSEHASSTFLNVEYHALQGARHGFSGSHRQAALNYMATFLAAHADKSQTKEHGNKISVSVAGKSFMASLADNETARAFTDLLPLTLNMTELNGNEKYNYLESNIPSAPSNLGTIHAGDIMLYGNNCVVVFYETFNTSYSYTKIGSIDDPAGLASAVGTGSVVITFSQSATSIQNTTLSEIKLNTIYNLQGMPVENPSHGIYIQNGHKIVI